MSSIPINTYDSPAMILELIYRLKVKNVMGDNLFTAEKNTPLRDIQKTMKQKMVTGMPIVEGRHLLGIISMDDIIRALEFGYIDDPAEAHMSRKLIVLEDDMPISFAITYFERYPYRRFPVLNKNYELVGIISPRDITTRLLVEINKEIEQAESAHRKSAAETVPGTRLLEFRVRKHDFENAGHASTEIKKLLKKSSVDSAVIRRIAIACYELEMNLVVHSDGGIIRAEFEPNHVTITAKDQGPGIEDVNQALKEGFSTANEWIRSLGFGAGLGLANVQRVSDDFEITSIPEKGTEARSVINIPQGGENYENS